MDEGRGGRAELPTWFVVGAIGFFFVAALGGATWAVWMRQTEQL